MSEHGVGMDQNTEDAKIESLRKYKELLDEGIISEQEFEQKKAELLGTATPSGNTSSDSERSFVEKKKEEEENKKEDTYNKALKLSEKRTAASLKEAISLFESIDGWKDSEEKIESIKRELPAIEEAEQKKAEEMKVLKAEKAKKRKKVLKRVLAALVVIIAIIVVIGMINNATKPDLSEEGKMTKHTIHSMNYEVPDTWAEESNNETLQRYIMKEDDEIVGVLDIEYKGESDLNGDAAYDDSHNMADVSDLIEGASGNYQDVEAGTSHFEVSVYAVEGEVKGESEILSLVADSFDVDGYKNPRKLEKVSVKYDGETKAGTVINESNSGLTVVAKYDTGASTGTMTPEYSVDPVTLKAGETSTVKVDVEGKTYKVDVTCSTMTKAQFKAKCKHMNYKNQLRKESKGAYITFSGKVLQDCGDGMFRISGDGDYGDVYMVVTDANIVEDDHVTVYGITSGIYEYETVMGANQKVPSVVAKYVDR